MLARVEKAVAVAGWVIAGALVLMLFVGPQLVAEDKEEPAAQEAAGASPYSGGSSGAAADGKALFTVNCGSCHTLSAAGTSGQVGPNLDEVGLDSADIESVVRSGQGAMPSFEGQLSDQDIATVAEFVAGSP